MKQGIRLVIKPRAFFNQLQWSPHHWFILITFLGLALIETQVGRGQVTYQAFASILVRSFGVSLEAALWLVSFFRLAFLAAGTFAITLLVWCAGNLFGRRTSHRVLFRRLAVVFTVMLAGYTASHYAAAQPWMAVASLFLYVWGLMLGYFAIREQFALNHLETMVVGLFALLLVSSTWHFASHMAESAVRFELAKRSHERSAFR